MKAIPSIGRLHVVYQGHAADIFNRSGLLKNRPFEEETQESLSESNKVLEEIKTSLKAINSEWNDNRELGKPALRRGRHLQSFPLSYRSNGFTGIQLSSKRVC